MCNVCRDAGVMPESKDLIMKSGALFDIINGTDSEIRFNSHMEDMLPMQGTPRMIDAHSFVWIIQEDRFINWNPGAERCVQIADLLFPAPFQNPPQNSNSELLGFSPVL